MPVTNFNDIEPVTDASDTVTREISEKESMQANEGISRYDTMQTNENIAGIDNAPLSEEETTSDISENETEVEGSSETLSEEKGEKKSAKILIVILLVCIAGAVYIIIKKKGLKNER